jgi:hypothetical protein
VLEGTELLLIFDELELLLEEVKLEELLDEIELDEIEVLLVEFSELLIVPLSQEAKIINDTITNGKE